MVAARNPTPCAAQMADTAVNMAILAMMRRALVILEQSRDAWSLSPSLKI